MAERKQTKKSTQKSTTSTRGTASKSKVLSDDERAALKELAKERKAEERWKKDREAGEKDLLAKVAEMPPADRTLGERLHEIITSTAPELTPRTWYGMPAYAKDGKVLCYFQNASKFNARYATFGFNDNATLDSGAMWPVAFALKELSSADEAKIRALVKKAVK